MASRLGSGGDKRSTAAGREQTDRKKDMIYLRERREKKRRRDSQKRVNIVYTFYPISWHSGYLLHFLLYIIRGYIVYIYIYNISPSNVYFSFKVNVYLDNTLLYG